MIQDDLTKKLAEAAKRVLADDNTNSKSDDGEGLDKVQPKAVKKKFDDRKDKDIDNDGDVDSSDKYLHKRRKAISKATKEEVELDEATELFKKGKITLTKFAMGKGKGVGLQINYGTKFIQVPEKDIKQLYTAMVYITKSVPQFKESVEVEEAYDSDEKHTMDPKSHVELNKETGMYCVYNIKGKKVAEFKTKEEAEEYAVKNHDSLMKESVELEEASKDWEVVVTMGVNKLKKGQKTVVKARNSAEAIKKAAKAFNINDKLITGKVDANLKEGFYYDAMSPKDKKRLNNIYKEMDKNEKQSKDAIKKGDSKTVDKLGKEYHKLKMQIVNFYNEDVEIEEETLEEGKFDKLQKKLGRINPETLGDVMDGKIKLNPAEKKEFDEFMKGVRKMFASK